MTVRSLGWLGVRTTAHEAMAGLWRDVLGATPIHAGDGATWFRIRDGTQVHVYADGDEDHAFFGRGPVVGLTVDDFAATHLALERAGVEFIGEVQRDGGRAWHHFRAPDGNVYEIMGDDPVADGASA
jgi:hypothetical protein